MKTAEEKRLDARIRKQKQRASEVGKAKDRECGWRMQGIVGASYQRYLELIVLQDCKCAICGGAIDNSSPLDHDHSITDGDNVRNVLCPQCNFIEGHVAAMRTVNNTSLVEAICEYQNNWKRG